MALDHNVTLSNDTLVMCASILQPRAESCRRVITDVHVECRVWISSANAAAVTEKGYQIIHAPSDYFYLASPSLDQALSE